MPKPLRVLMVEASEDDSLLVLDELGRGGYSPISMRVDSRETMAAALAGGDWDIILADYRLPRFSGPAALKLARENSPDLPFIIVSGAVGEDVAVGIVKAGANDYVMKSNLEYLPSVVEREIREARERRQRRESEEALRASEEKLRRMFESITDSVVITDLSANIIECNDGTLRMYGGSKQEVLGRNVLEFIAASDRPRAAENMKKTLEDGYVKNAAYTCLARDGAEFLVELSAAILRGASGNPAGFIAVTRDITERKRAELSLLESQTKWRSLVDNTPFGLVIVSAEGRILEVNNALVRMHGYESREEFIKAPASERYLDSEDRGRFLSVAATAGLVEGFEVQLKRKNGSSFWASMTSVLRTTERQQQELLTVVQDITEHRKAEEELWQSLSFNAAVLDNAPNPMVVTNIDTSVRYVNPAFERLSGFSVLEVLGKKFPYPWWPDELVEQYDRDRDIPPEQRPRVNRSERIYQKANGERLPVQLSVTDVKVGEDVKFHISNWVDLTELKTAESSIRISEERFRRLSDATFEGIVISEGGKILDANQTLATMLGCELPEIIGKDVLNFVAPEFRDQVKQHVASGAEGPYEATCVRKDGSRFPAEARARMLLHDGRALRIAAVRDISERKQAELALRESEERLRRTFETAQVGIVILDADLRIVDLNETKLRMHGYDSKEELIGRSTLILTPENRRDVGRESFRRALETGTAREAEVTLLRNDGSEFPGELSYAPLQDAAGHHIGFISISRDITERKLAEWALKESEGKYSTLVQSSNDGIVIIQDSVIRFANQKGIEMTGLPPDEVMGKPFVSFVCPEYRELVVERYKRRMAGETVPNRYEVEIFSKGGRMAVEISASPILFEGRPSDMALVHDITERKRAESETRRLMEELQMFAYTAAHDLQAPLVTIQGFAGMLRRDLEKGRQDRVEEDLRLIETGIANMRRLLKGTLDYARISRAVKPGENIPFKEIVDDSLRLAASQITFSQASVSVADDLPVVYVDRIAMVHALSNLIQNSTEYRSKTRPLIIEMGQRQAEAEIVYFVRDNGVGIDPEEQENVFLPFYRGAKESRGYGLGLTIVKRIIEGHSGRIWIESEIDRGTNVCFTLGQR